MAESPISFETTHSTLEGKARFRQFLARMSELISESETTELELLDRGARALGELVRHDDWLDERFALPSEDRYQQYLLYCDAQERFSVVSFVWGPGQQTPVHNHTTWGIIGMLRGAEISKRYNLSAGILENIGEGRLAAGDVETVSPTIGDIHQVRNAFDDQVSISIHVYGGDIGSIRRQAFAEDGTVKQFISGYSNTIIPNYWGMH